MSEDSEESLGHKPNLDASFMNEHWVLFPILPGGGSHPSTVIEICPNSNVSIGRAELFLPDKRISRAMFILNCDDKGQLSVEGQGMNTSYVRLAGATTNTTLRRGVRYPVNTRSKLLLLPGGLYTVEVYHFADWEHDNPDDSLAAVRERGQRLAIERARSLRSGTPATASTSTSTSAATTNKKNSNSLAQTSPPNLRAAAEAARKGGRAEVRSKSPVRLRSRSPGHHSDHGSKDDDKKAKKTVSASSEWAELPIELGNVHRCRAYLPDSVIWRQLGIHNTFKTLVLTESTTVEQMRSMMLDKICTGMTQTQRTLVLEECRDYTLYNFLPSGALAKFNDSECPFRTVRKLAFRSMKTPLPAPPTEDELVKKSIPNLLVQPLKAKHIELPEGMKMIRAFVDDNRVFRELGIHNTFKTLIVNSETTVEQLQPMLVRKLSKAMTPAQITQLNKQCEGYRLYLPSQVGADILLDVNATPYSLGDELLFKKYVAPAASESFDGPDQKVIRAYLTENMVFKQLGLNNTFKALVVTPTTTVAMMQDMMLKKMCKAMTPIQTQVVSKACHDYSMFELRPDGTSREMELFEKPFGIIKEVLFKPSEEHHRSASPSRGRSLTSSNNADRGGVRSTSPSSSSSSHQQQQQEHHNCPLSDYAASVDISQSDGAATSEPNSSSPSSPSGSPLLMSASAPPVGGHGDDLDSIDGLGSGTDDETTAHHHHHHHHHEDDGSGNNSNNKPEESKDESTTSSSSLDRDDEHRQHHAQTPSEPDSTIVFPQVPDDDLEGTPTPASVLLASPMPEEDDEEHLLRINIEVTAGWKIKIPTSSDASISSLIREIRLRLRSKLDRIIAAGINPEAIENLTLQDGEGVELFEEDSVSDAWAEGETLFIFWP